jgi:hypothetical protein
MVWIEMEDFCSSDANRGCGKYLIDDGGGGGEIISAASTKMIALSGSFRNQTHPKIGAQERRRRRRRKKEG